MVEIEEDRFQYVKALTPVMERQFKKVAVGFSFDYCFFSCTENGTWYMRPEAKKPWTNYTTCVDMEDLDVSIKF